MVIVHSLKEIPLPKCGKKTQRQIFISWLNGYSLCISQCSFPNNWLDSLKHLAFYKISFIYTEQNKNKNPGVTPSALECSVSKFITIEYTSSLWDNKNDFYSTSKKKSQNPL